MATKNHSPKVSIDKPQDLISSDAQSLTNSMADLGLECLSKGADSIALFFKVTIGTSTNVQMRALAKHKSSLKAAIDLANECKSLLNAHYADAGSGTEEHIAAQTAVSTNNAKDLGSCQDLIASLLTSYDAHDADAELGAAWVYHQAQEAGDASLASTVKPTSLAECHTRLQDLKTKFNTHAADSTAHTNGDNTLVTDQGDVEYVLPIKTVSSSDVKIEDEYFELNDDANQNVIIEVPLNGVVPVVQFQVKDAAGGTGTIDSAVVTFKEE
jgi:hypothetical protein